MAHSPEVPLSLETILLAADNELLSAKKSGRNQVMFTVLGIGGTI
jgi:GGDEF domain-containing protein